MTVVRICEKGTPFGPAALELELVRWWTDMGPRTPIVWNTDWLSPSVTSIKSQNVNVSVGHFGNGFATFLRELRKQISRHSRRTMSMSQSQMRFVNFFGQNICKKKTRLEERFHWTRVILIQWRITGRKKEQVLLLRLHEENARVNTLLDQISKIVRWPSWIRSWLRNAWRQTSKSVGYRGTSTRIWDGSQSTKIA